MKPLGPASVAGSLYDLGPYPGVTLDASTGRVFGHLFELPDDEAVLRALDTYEGFDPRQPDAGLFRRETCLATLDDGGEAACDVYVYNGKPAESQRVASGKWRPGETD